MIAVNSVFTIRVLHDEQPKIHGRYWYALLASGVLTYMASHRHVCLIFFLVLVPVLVPVLVLVM